MFCLWKQIKSIYCLTVSDQTEWNTISWLTFSVFFSNMHLSLKLMVWKNPSVSIRENPSSPHYCMCASYKYCTYLYVIWSFGFCASVFVHLQCIFCTVKCLNVYVSSSSSLGMRSRTLSLRWLFSELYSFCSFSSSWSSACSRCRCIARRFLTCFIRNGFKSQKAMLVNFLKGTSNRVKTVRTVGKTNLGFLNVYSIIIIVILDD